VVAQAPKARRPDDTRTQAQQRFAEQTRRTREAAAAVEERRRAGRDPYPVPALRLLREPPQEPVQWPRITTLAVAPSAGAGVSAPARLLAEWSARGVCVSTL
jgi:anti-sigma factor RsiW